jgi:hypothetical protein
MAHQQYIYIQSCRRFTGILTNDFPRRGPDIKTFIRYPLIILMIDFHIDRQHDDRALVAYGSLDDGKGIEAVLL